MLWRWRGWTGYVAAVSLSFVIAMAAGWTPLADRIDGAAYDWLFRLQPGKLVAPSSIVLALDDETLAATGGMRNVRGTLARALETIAGLGPKAVAIDLTLPDVSDQAQDNALEAALCKIPNLVLASDLTDRTIVWSDQLPRFRRCAAVIAHVHAAPDPVSRAIPLEVVSRGRERRWAMSLEAFRLSRRAAGIVESPRELEVGGTIVPAGQSNGRMLFIRYGQPIPTVSAVELERDPAARHRVRGSVVFVGVTPQSAARDRLMTPFGTMMSGVEIHAQAYETLAGAGFLTRPSDSIVLLVCLLIACVAGFVFAFVSGWQVYAAGFGLLMVGHLVPHAAFSSGIIFPYLAPVLTSWLTVASAAAWQHFGVRRQLLKSESDRERYQQAIHFVTHEMRSPLTAIQGSSELMGRYPLNEEKRKQMALMINSESKRLAKMIETFLNIERLTDGKAEIRSEPIEVDALVGGCLQRARPLAEQKEIGLEVSRPYPAGPVQNHDRKGVDLSSLYVKGDQELLEYAVYNLLTNAIKYSPENTTVSVSTGVDGANLRLAVTDQGIGMDSKELRQIFKKFYRTKKAEESGEVGTGIGLSIVEQIVGHHGGRMEVTSKPGEGSCFTMVLPCMAPSEVHG